jgi:hypothetical protein
LKSPLPPEWSDGTKQLREIADRLRELLHERDGGKITVNGL